MSRIAPATDLNPKSNSPAGIPPGWYDTGGNLKVIIRYQGRLDETARRDGDQIISDAPLASAILESGNFASLHEGRARVAATKTLEGLVEAAGTAANAVLVFDSHNGRTEIVLSYPELDRVIAIASRLRNISSEVAKEPPRAKWVHLVDVGSCSMCGQPAKRGTSIENGDVVPWCEMCAECHVEALRPSTKNQASEIDELPAYYASCGMIHVPCRMLSADGDSYLCLANHVVVEAAEEEKA